MLEIIGNVGSNELSGASSGSTSLCDVTGTEDGSEGRILSVLALVMLVEFKGDGHGRIGCPIREGGIDRSGEGPDITDAVDTVPEIMVVDGVTARVPVKYGAEPSGDDRPDTFVIKMLDWLGGAILSSHSVVSSTTE
jgi:hypothetical protein